jgi:DHA3 family macrolide efflux protein-like MFS transporter
MVRPDMQGRVFGVQSLIFNTIMPVGMLVFGPIADRVSIEFLLVLSSALMIVPGLWIFFNRMPVAAPSLLPSTDFEPDAGD